MMKTDTTAPLPRAILHHLNWTTAFEFVGGLGAPGAYVGYRLYTGQGIGVSVAEGATFFGLFILGLLVPRAVFRHFIAATCPDCHGRAFPKGTKPIVYVCRSCGRSYPTELWEGDDGQILPGKKHETGDDR